MYVFPLACLLHFSNVRASSDEVCKNDGGVMMSELPMRSLLLLVALTSFLVLRTQYGEQRRYLHSMGVGSLTLDERDTRLLPTGPLDLRAPSNEPVFRRLSIVSSAISRTLDAFGVHVRQCGTLPDAPDWYGCFDSQLDYDPKVRLGVICASRSKCRDDPRLRSTHIVTDGAGSTAEVLRSSVRGSDGKSEDAYVLIVREAAIVDSPDSFSRQVVDASRRDAINLGLRTRCALGWALQGQGLAYRFVRAVPGNVPSRR